MQTEIDNLPYDLVFQILIHLPAEYIYDNAMLVCRRWYRMIRTQEFIRAHFNLRTTQPDFSVTTRNEPAIKTHFVVPRFSQQMSWLPDCRSYTIAYSAASMHYKVVVAYTYPYLQVRCAILTMGVDKFWRDVCTEHLPPESKFYVTNNPIATEGFIHWVPPDGQTRILTLNVETETITQYPVPRAHDYEQIDKCYLSTGKSLSLFFVCSDFSMDVWEMESRTGEWSKMCSIDLEHLSLSRLSPVGWLKCREVVVFHLPDPTRVRIAYDVRTQEIDLFNLGSGHNNYEFEIHTKSFVGLIGM
ncbi:hypothetical protein ABFS82_04G060300 [Erythranthe guttata]